VEGRYSRHRHGCAGEAPPSRVRWTLGVGFWSRRRDDGTHRPLIQVAPMMVEIWRGTRWSRRRGMCNGGKRHQPEEVAVEGRHGLLWRPWEETWQHRGIDGRTPLHKLRVFGVCNHGIDGHLVCSITGLMAGPLSINFALFPLLVCVITDLFRNAE
jgi:hypothetical protein